MKLPFGFIRGGRLRKTSKGLISFAPFLTGVSVLVLGALLATTTQVEAGTCAETDTPGVWTCTGAAGSDDGKQEISGRENQDVSITGDATFALNVSGSDGIRVLSKATTGTIDIDLSNGNNITAYYYAIQVDSDGTGAVTVTTNGSLTSTGYDGIHIDQSGNGRITVTTGDVTGTNEGINISTNAGTTGGVEVTTNGSITGGAEGIYLEINGGNAVTVIANGTVTSNNNAEAISIAHSGTGDVAITTADTVTTNSASDSAINVNHSGTGDIALTVNGRVVGGSSANAIDLTAASGNAIIILGTGASFTGGIDVSGVMGTTSLEIGGTGDRSFDIGDLPAITGDRNFNKNGDNTLTVTGTHASGAAFEQTNINEGKFVWGGTDFRTTSLAIANGATLEITGSGSFTDTPVTLSGRLELTGNSANVTVGSLTGGGEIDIDVDFSGGDAELTNARLTATSVTGTIPVNIRSIAGFPEIPEGEEEDRTVRIGNVIRITGTANADAFVMGRALNEGFRFVQLVHDDSSGDNVWTVVAEVTREENAGSIEQALYESLPAALTQLASLESYQQRLQGRQHADNTAMWGRIEGASGEFEPNSAAGAIYETENIAAEFGIEAPIHINGASALTLGASVAFGDATTDVSVPGSIGEIDSESITGAVSASWERKGIYVDGQLRYTNFDNAIETDAKIADTNAESYNAGIEVGYTMELDRLIGRSLRPDATLTPSAQIAWTSVDFDDFTDANSMDVSLEDGEVLLARAGVAFEDAWKDISLRGYADVLVPLDGEVATKLDETEMTSKRKDPVFDLGIGSTYSWGGAYALSADISTQQGGEVTGYTASLGFVYSFF